METETGITPEVNDHIAAVNRERIEKTTDFRYHRIFWGAYKQHVHELMVGIGVGTVAGAIAGLAAFAFFPILTPAAIIVGAAGGLAYAAEKISSIGASSGAHAASLAEKHAAALAPENEGDPLKAANDMLMNGKGGHDYDFGEEKRKLFYWKSGLLGTALGAASGALLGAIALFEATAAHLAIEAIPIIGHLLGAGAIAAAFGAAAPIVVGAVAFGLLGLTFGIDRGMFKSLFNKIDGFLTGRKTDIDHGKIQAESMGISEDELTKRRLTRQENIHALQNAYDKNIFMGGLRGYLKGLAGGLAIGALIGAAIGLATLGIIAIAAPALAAAAPIIMTAAVTGFAGYFGTVFSESGYNAGTEAATRAIDDELPRTQAAAKGITQTNPDLQNEDRGFVGRTFDGILGGVRKISEASKNLYNQVNDHPAGPEIVPLSHSVNPNLPYHSSQVTLEDARELEQRLQGKNAACANAAEQKDFTSNVTSKNISDIIKEQGAGYSDFTTMLANQKTDFITAQNKN